MSKAAFAWARAHVFRVAFLRLHLEGLCMLSSSKVHCSNYVVHGTRLGMCFMSRLRRSAWSRTSSSVWYLLCLIRRRSCGGISPGTDLPKTFKERAYARRDHGDAFGFRCSWWPLCKSSSAWTESGINHLVKGRNVLSAWTKKRKHVVKHHKTDFAPITPRECSSVGCRRICIYTNKPPLQGDRGLWGWGSVRRGPTQTVCGQRPEARFLPWSHARPPLGRT